MDNKIQNFQNELLEIKVSLSDALERVDALLLSISHYAQHAECEPAPMKEPTPEPIAKPTPQPVIEPIAAPEPEPDAEEPDAEEETDDEEPTSVQHRSATSIVFTLNDRFRFRRELFGNSEAEMADTVNLLSAMSSMSEVEDYLLNDLEWDADNQEVQDFIAIVARKFTDRPPLLG